MDGKHLQFTKEGVMYKYGNPLPLDNLNTKLVGGKTFKSLDEALSNLKKKLSSMDPPSKELEKEKDVLK